MRLFNVGAEGQLYVGAICADAAGLYLGGRGGASVPVIAGMVAAGCIGGASWALVPGILRAFLKTNEIITSLMLNYVAGTLLTYLVFDSDSYWRQTTGFNAAVFPTSKALPNSAILAGFGDQRAGRHLLVPLGAGIAVAIAILLLVRQRAHARFGFEVQVLGDSTRAGRYAGMRVRRKILAVMAISGAVAGLGGAKARSAISRTCSTPTPTGCRSSTTATRGSSSRRSLVITRSPSSSSHSLLGGLQNAGNTLQGPSFPSGLVGVLTQGMLLFSALGGELLVRYRVRSGKRPRAALPDAAA